MEEEEIKPKVGHNWNWPRKTWLQKRLDIIKARERENNPRSGDSAQNPTSGDVESANEKKPGEP